MSERSEPRRDPLAAIFALGSRQLRTGALIGLAGALIVHGAAAGQAVSAMFDVAAFASSVRSQVHDRLRAEYDLDVSQPETPPPPPEPEPEPEEQPKAPPQAAKAPPPDAPPPAAAQAANVLTADADPNAPLDLTGEGFVVGTAETYAGGVTASAGNSKKAVRDLRAAPTGVGQVAKNVPVAATAAPAVDLSRQPKAVGNWADNCPFPAESNAEGVNHAVVLLTVTIGADGTIKSASVAQDPGTGFGPSARACALQRGRFEPALDTAGNAVPKTTTLRIKYNR